MNLLLLRLLFFFFFLEKNLDPSKKRLNFLPFSRYVSMYSTSRYIFSPASTNLPLFEEQETPTPKTPFLPLVLYSKVVAVVVGGSSITKSKNRGFCSSSSAS